MDEVILGRAVEHHGPDFLRQLQIEQQNVPPNSFLHLQRHRPMVPEINDPQFIQNVRKFVSKKADILFCPIDKSVQRSAPLEEEDCYAKMPPLETFMGVDPNTTRAHLYHSLQVGDLLVGVVTAIQDSGLILNLLCMDQGKNRDIDDLRINAFVPVKEIPKMFPTQNPVEGYQLKDYIRGVVVSINPETENIILSLMDAALGEIEGTRPTLGLIHEEDFPVEFRRKLHIRGLTFDELVNSICGFTNPGSVSCLLGMLHQTQNASLMRGLHRLKIPDKEYADSLKKQQSQKMAYQSVAKGIAMFKEGKQSEAMQELNKALNIDPQNVEAFVARGALYANNESYSRALTDFEDALAINPKHPNAIKYMHDTLLAKGKIHEDTNDWEDAESCYKKALDVVPESQEAKEYIRYVHYRLEASGSRKKSKPDKSPEAEEPYRQTANLLRKLIKEDDHTSKSKKKARRDSLSPEGHRRSRKSFSPDRSRRHSSSSSSSDRSRSRGREGSKHRRSKKYESSGKERSRSRDDSRQGREDDQAKRSYKQGHEEVRGQSQPYTTEYKPYRRDEKIPFLNDSPVNVDESEQARPQQSYDGREGSLTPTKDEVNDRLGLEDISPELYGESEARHEDLRYRHLDRPHGDRDTKGERGGRDSKEDRMYSPERKTSPRRQIYIQPRDSSKEKYRERQQSATKEYSSERRRSYVEDTSSEKRRGYDDDEIKSRKQKSYSRERQFESPVKRRKRSPSFDRERHSHSKGQSDARHSGYVQDDEPISERRIISVTKREKKPQDMRGDEREQRRREEDWEGRESMGEEPRSQRKSQYYSPEETQERRSVVVSSKTKSGNHSHQEYERKSISVGGKDRSHKSRRSESSSDDNSRQSYSRERSQQSRRSVIKERSKMSSSHDKSHRSRRSSSSDSSYKRSHSGSHERRVLRVEPKGKDQEDKYERVVQVKKRNSSADRHFKEEKVESGEGRPGKSGDSSDRMNIKTKEIGTALNSKIADMFEDLPKPSASKTLQMKFATYVPRSVKLKQQVHQNPESSINPERKAEDSGFIDPSQPERSRDLRVENVIEIRDMTKHQDRSRSGGGEKLRSQSMEHEERRVVKVESKRDFESDPRFKYRPRTPEGKKYKKYRSPSGSPSYDKSHKGSSSRKKRKSRSYSRSRSRSRSYDKHRKSKRSRSRSYDKYKRSRRSRSRSYEKKRSRRSRSGSYERYKKSKKSRSRSQSHSKRSYVKEEDHENKTEGDGIGTKADKKVVVPKLHSRWDSPKEKRSRWETEAVMAPEQKGKDVTKIVSQAQEQLASIMAANMISSSPPPHRPMKPEEKAALEKKWKELDVTPPETKVKTIQESVKEAKTQIERTLQGRNVFSGADAQASAEKTSTSGKKDKKFKLKGLRSKWDSDSNSSDSDSSRRSESPERQYKHSSHSRRKSGSERRGSSEREVSSHSGRTESGERKRRDSGKNLPDIVKSSKSDEKEQRVFWFHKEAIERDKFEKTPQKFRGSFRGRGAFRGRGGATESKIQKKFKRMSSSSSRSRSRSKSPKSKKSLQSGYSKSSSESKYKAGSKSKWSSDSESDENHSKQETKRDTGEGKPNVALNELETFLNKLKTDKKKKLEQDAKPGDK